MSTTEGRKSGDVLRETIEKLGFAAFSTSGMSMYPLLKNRRDVSVVKAPCDIGKYDVVLYEDTSGRLILHRVIKIKGNKAYIRGDNCTVGEWVDSSQYIGKLDSFTRNGKDGNCGSFSYKAYSRFIVIAHPFVFLKIKAKEYAYSLYRKIFKSRTNQ